MAEFEVPIVRITDVKDHPDADRLSLIYFRGFAVVSGKLADGSHRYSVGDLVIYCPQDSVIPEYLLKQGYFKYDIAFDFESGLEAPNSENPVTIPAALDTDTPGSTLTVNGVIFTVLSTGKGMLRGSEGNRVKPVVLRGALSEGIMFPVIVEEPEITIDGKSIYELDTSFTKLQLSYILNEKGEELPVNEGDNVADFLGITKYEPVLPTGMSGEVCYIGTHIIPHFDVENIKKYPNTFEADEEIVVTEKLHGSFFGIGYVPGLNHPDLWDGDYFCYSKGQGSKGLAFKNSEMNKSNLYVKQFERILPHLKKITENTHHATGPKFFMAEIFGKGVQDLHYGLQEADVRLFDAYSNGNYTVWDEVELSAKHLNVSVVPVLFRGKYSDYDSDLKNGNSTFAKHVREGAVIKPVVPRYIDGLGRVILKDINERYLMRKGGTEYN